MRQVILSTVVLLVSCVSASRALAEYRYSDRCIEREQEQIRRQIECEQRQIRREIYDEQYYGRSCRREVVVVEEPYYRPVYVGIDVDRGISGFRLETPFLSLDYHRDNYRDSRDSRCDYGRSGSHRRR
jgi:hypothetical protein